MSTSSKARNRRRNPRPGDLMYTFTRRDKRRFRKVGMDDPVYQAFIEGQELAEMGPDYMPPRLRSNRYPPGRRHDEWQRGFDVADPMGEHHGRNE